MMQSAVGETVLCPCRGDLATIQRLEGEHLALRCLACGLLAREPLPSAEDLARWYAEGYWTQYRAEQVGQDRRNVHAHVLAWLGARRPAKGTLVDVGCGGGAFLHACRSAGWRGIGFDPSAAAVAHARADGLEVHALSWPPCPLADEQMDAVTMINVLDHLRDPFDALREARRVLKPDGLLYIRVPNGPFHARVMALPPWMGLHGLAVFHLYGFGRRSLLYHLRRAGFSGVTVRAAPPALGDAYGDGGAWRDRLRRGLKMAARGADRLLQTCGLGRLVWGPSIEVMAVKGAVKGR